MKEADTWRLCIQNKKGEGEKGSTMLDRARQGETTCLFDQEKGTLELKRKLLLLHSLRASCEKLIKNHLDLPNINVESGRGCVNLACFVLCCFELLPFLLLITASFMCHVAESLLITIDTRNILSLQLYCFCIWQSYLAILQWEYLMTLK